MTERALVYRIIRRDGSPACDFDGVEVLLATREEALRWLMPGESVERVKR